MAKEWFPHEYVPWSDGRNYDGPLNGDPWTVEDSQMSDVARSALIVNLLTEDNLPSYHHEIATLFGREAAWGDWVHRWTAEEGRHGIAIRDYLLTTRAVDPVQLERLRMDHMSTGYTALHDDMIRSLAYVSFQELATRVSHRNTGKITGDAVGDQLLARVAADENLHMVFYRNLLGAALELDPSQTMRAITDVVTSSRCPAPTSPGSSARPSRWPSPVSTTSGSTATTWWPRCSGSGTSSRSRASTPRASRPGPSSPTSWPSWRSRRCASRTSATRCRPGWPPATRSNPIAPVRRGWHHRRMHFVFVFGPPAVGKMTVGRELAALTGYKLLHNHRPIEPLLDVFEFGSPAFGRLVDEFRRRVIEEALAAELPGLVFTMVWGLDLPQDRDLVSSYVDLVEGAGGRVSFVELYAGLGERLERNRTELRLAEKRSKRDLEFSHGNVRPGGYVMSTGAAPTLADDLLAAHEHLRLDNTDIPPAEPPAGSPTPCAEVTGPAARPSPPRSRAPAGGRGRGRRRACSRSCSGR